MKKCAVLLFCDSNLVPALGNTLIQLSKFEFIDNIIIEHTIEDNKVIELLKGIDSRSRFIHVNNSAVYERLTFDIENNSYMKLYGASTLQKFFASKYFDEFENIIIADIDMCFMSDFSGIITGEPIAYKSRGWLNQYIDLPVQRTIPNCGLIVLNKRILNYCNDLASELFKVVNEYSTLNSLDEIAYAMVVHKFNIPLNLLDKEKYNSTPVSKNSRKASIVHGASPYKFWVDPAVNFCFPIWNDANDKWNKLCLDNGVLDYSFDLGDSFFLSEKNIIDMYFNIGLYKEIFNASSDFKIYMTEKWDFIKIYLKEYPEDFHIEIARLGRMVRVMVHEESTYRRQSPIFKKYFYQITGKIPGAKTREVNGRLEVYLICRKDNLKNTLLSVYESIKESLPKYFELESILRKLNA